jgi:hypothetical protein
MTSGLERLNQQQSEHLYSLPQMRRNYWRS